MEMYVRFLFLSGCLFAMLVIADEGCCWKTPAGLCSKCCNNYFLVDGLCSECQPGFFGKNCSDVCTYPHFGTTCLQKCHCDEHLCDPVLGCQEESTTNHIAKTSVYMTEMNLENTEQKTNENDHSMANFIDSSHLQIVIIVGGVALGFCIFTIIFLVIIIVRRQQNSRVLDAEYHELQMLRHHKENLERKTTPVEMNNYKSIRSVVSKSRPSDNTASHCYQDIQDYTDIGRNAEKCDNEKHDIGLSDYQKLEDPSITDGSYETPIVKEGMLSEN